MTTSIITPQIASFAEAVRDALHDLPAEEREELTEGLEADLAEAYAEDLERELPDPVEYATELRNAAGLPKSETTEVGMFATLALSMRRTRASMASVVRENPALEPVVDFLVASRPAWWLVRAWVAAGLVSAFLGLNSGFIPMSGLVGATFILLLVVSVQWGRGRWGADRLTPVIVLGNVAAALLLLPVADWANQDTYAYVNEGPGDLTGVYLDGEPVTNIFPYDADGEPLEDVQLFTDAGRPLATSVQGGNGCFDDTCDTPALWFPRSVESGTPVFNVFPMSMIAGIYGEYGDVEANPDAVPEDRKSPFLKVPALLAPSNE